MPVHLLLEQISTACPRWVAEPPLKQCWLVPAQYWLVVCNLERVLLLIVAVEASIVAVAPALTRRVVVLLHRRPADISDCFQLKFFVSIEIVVPAEPSQPVEAAAAAFVVASSVECFQPWFALAVAAAPCSCFAVTSSAVVASLNSSVGFATSSVVASCFLFAVVVAYFAVAFHILLVDHTVLDFRMLQAVFVLVLVAFRIQAVVGPGYHMHSAEFVFAGSLGNSLQPASASGSFLVARRSHLLPCCSYFQTWAHPLHFVVGRRRRLDMADDIVYSYLRDTYCLLDIHLYFCYIVVLIFGL